MVEQAMDEGCLAQCYYRKQKAKIRLEGERKETSTYDDYSWTEHIAPKWGQWKADPRELLEPLDQCGFTICRKRTHKRRPYRSEGRRSPSRLPAQRLVAGEWVFAAL